MEHGGKPDVPLHSSELSMTDGATNSHPVGSHERLQKLMRLLSLKSVLDDVKKPEQSHQSH